MVSVDAADAQPAAQSKAAEVLVAEIESREVESGRSPEAQGGAVRLPQLSGKDNGAGEGIKPTEPEPISIIRGPQGLIITSKDPATVEQLSKLIDELSPSNSQYQVFTLKHTYARDVSYLLEKIFEKDDGSKGRGFNPFFFDFDSQDKKDERGRLSKRAPLKFTPDAVTNSILVQNADSEQLAANQTTRGFLRPRRATRFAIDSQNTNCAGQICEGAGGLRCSEGCLSRSAQPERQGAIEQQ